MYNVDVYNEWHNRCGTKQFENLEDAKKSGLKVLEQDPTEQLLGFAIFNEEGEIICSKSHWKDMEYYIEKKEISRFEIMDI